MAFNDFYAVLEVAQNCSSTDITVAYRQLALRLHPDKNAGNPHATENFQLLGTAYEILKDEQKRRVYDIKYQEYRNSKPAPKAPNSKLQRKLEELIELYRTLSQDHADLEHSWEEALRGETPEGYEDYAVYGGDEEEVQAAILSHLSPRKHALEMEILAAFHYIQQVKAQLRA